MAKSILSEEQQGLSFTADAVFTGTSGNDVLNGTKFDDTLQGLAGDDWLEGNNGDDILDGGAGNDAMEGGLGSDDYLFGIGSGHDSINEGYKGTDRILLGAGITPDDIVLQQFDRDSHLHLSIMGSDDQLTIYWQFSSYNKNAGVENIVFADGTVWTKADIQQHLQVTDTADEIHRGGGDDIIDGLGGNDWLYGGGGNDTLDGGVGGVDGLAGEAGNDTYLFGADSGHDVLLGLEASGDFDRLLLDSGITAADVSVEREHFSGTELILTINGTGAQLIVREYFLNPNQSIDVIEFADGTTWDQQDVFDMVNIITAGDDFVEGTTGADTIDGLGGHDNLYGLDGNDLLLGSGGHDKLYGGAGSDVLKGGGGDDSLLGDNGKDTLIGGAGNDFLTGGGGKDALQGGEGDDQLLGGTGLDLLTGGNGADQFTFYTPYDQASEDTITDFTAGSDTIALWSYHFSRFGDFASTVKAENFVANASGTAQDADDYLVYETDTGKLFYDIDGNGAFERELFAILGQDTHPALSASDFKIF